MRDPVSRETSGEGVAGAVTEATSRLNQAVSRLEARLAERPGDAEAALAVARAHAEEVEQDRDHLAADLRASMDRERALEAAAAAASQALGLAAAEVRAALQDGEADGPDRGSEAKIMDEEEAA